MAGSFVIGLLLRLVQVRILRKQVLELEREKMEDHAEILHLQKLLADQQSRPDSLPATPVVSLKDKDSGQPDNNKNFRATQ